MVVSSGTLAFLLSAAGPSMSTPAAPVPIDSSWSDRQLPDAAAEARAADLMRTLRCVVCQGQSISDSDADLAGDMRGYVRGRIAAGADSEAVRDELISRYGQWVSYRPVLDRTTWPLWLLPCSLALIGTWLARGRLLLR